MHCLLLKALRRNDAMAGPPTEQSWRCQERRLWIDIAGVCGSLVDGSRVVIVDHSVVQRLRQMVCAWANAWGDFAVTGGLLWALAAPSVYS